MIDKAGNHICPICGERLQIADSYFVPEGDNSPDTPTQIFVELVMVCTNSRIDPIKKTRVCSNYCGADLNNPKKIVETIKNPVNQKVK